MSRGFKVCNDHNTDTLLWCFETLYIPDHSFWVYTGMLLWKREGRMNSVKKVKAKTWEDENGQLTV